MPIDSKDKITPARRVRSSVLVGSLLLSVLLGSLGGVTLSRLRAAERTGGQDRTASQSRVRQPVASLSAKKCPPSVKLESLPKTVATDPSQSGYDPIALRRSGVSAKDVFDSQPAGGEWAKRMQNAVGIQLVQDIRAVVPESSDLEFVCKSWSCSLSWTPMSDELNYRLIGLAMLSAVGPNVHFGSEPDRKTIYFFYPSPDQFPLDNPKIRQHFDTSQPERFAATWQERRRTSYTAFNQGKRRGLSRKYDGALRSVRLPE